MRQVLSPPGCGLQTLNGFRTNLLCLHTSQRRSVGPYAACHLRVKRALPLTGSALEATSEQEPALKSSTHITHSPAELDFPAIEAHPNSTTARARRQRRRTFTDSLAAGQLPNSSSHETSASPAAASNHARGLAADGSPEQRGGAAPNSTAKASAVLTAGAAADASIVVGPRSTSISIKRSTRRTSPRLDNTSDDATRAPSFAAGVSSVAASNPDAAAQTAPALPRATASEDRAWQGSSRSNPVLRAIRIMQLRKQQAKNAAALAGLESQSSNQQQNAAVEVASRSRGKLQPLQQQPGLESGTAVASPAAAGPPPALQQQPKPRAALPAEEVLVTETSHLNPVYRRIRLQELRLRLQQQLRGPQLQQQLLQVQQQHTQRPVNPAGQQEPARPSSAPATTANNSSSRFQGTTRGPTQGLNSVQRAIRMAQLQRVLQQRSRRPADGAASTSQITAAGAVPAGMQESWFLPEASRLSNSSQARQSHHSSTSAVTTSAAADTQAFMQKLIVAGVPAAAAHAIVAHGGTSAALVGSDASGVVLDRILKLQVVLGLPNIGAAAKIVIKQPNLLKRDPETLRHNLQTISSKLQLSPSKVQKLLQQYPAALDMSPASVADRAATLAATLGVPARQAVKVACGCPRILGASAETISGKVSDLQAALELPSKVAAVELILGFPGLLGLNPQTLSAKYQRLKALAEQRQDWGQQLEHICKHKPGSLGRVLAAGPRVVDRLQYLLAAEDRDGSDVTRLTPIEASATSVSSMKSGQSNPVLGSLHGNELKGLGRNEGPRQDQYSAKDVKSSTLHDSNMSKLKFAKSSVGKGGLPGGNLVALLVMSEAQFTAIHPEFVLWRLQQRSTAVMPVTPAGK